MAKPDIHPKWYPNAKVFCDGQLVMKVGSTKPRLNVDIWSGNHPFYTGSQQIIDSDAEISIMIDKGWRQYWQLRFTDPLTDAESLILNDDNTIAQLGKKTPNSVLIIFLSRKLNSTGFTGGSKPLIPLKKANLKNNSFVELRLFLRSTVY